MIATLLVGITLFWGNGAIYSEKGITCKQVKRILEMTQDRAFEDKLCAFMLKSNRTKSLNDCYLFWALARDSRCVDTEES